ncbi:hypothetical protein BDP81DRAFT_415207 [Colletotrichum phormii]|uniref:Uncharacterized protein n=1 Tax=Colletotrichum phormii TaxID=359342 RepID=A0AAJ0EIJ2_9PEZI|nr:uncharacterized protein BDP81DRAFT_415207 [Colletotrichum phormii]KAK1654210.1 hypothetical protein BDP81DRAFT_415207 [Colletotrichum phormii]
MSDTRAPVKDNNCFRGFDLSVNGAEPQMVEFPSIAAPSQEAHLGSEHRRRHLHVHSPAVVSRI